MKIISLRTAALAISMWAGWCSTAAHAAGLCHNATPQALISWYQQQHPRQPLRYDPQNSAIYHPIASLHTRSPELHWIGLAWLSPVSGALFATACDGSPLAAIAAGAIGKLSAGPVVPGLGQTVMIEYVDHETADCVHDSISILAWRDGKIIPLWRHESKQGMNIRAARSAFDGFVSREYAVTFAADAQTLHVTGQLSAYPYLEDGTQSAVAAASKPLPAERYRWDAGKLRFVAHEKYIRFKPCVSLDWPSAR